MLALIAALVGLVWYSALWVIGIVGCLTARKRYRLRPRSPLSSQSPNSVPGVSILRPLKGLDTNLYENLESTFKQEYPRFEILLSVADEADQALPVARELLAKYPNIEARIIIGEEVIGVNPKVNNLIRSYRQAKHDILWVIDSNVVVHPGTLARSVDALATPLPSGKRVGLVHHVPFAYTPTAEPSPIGSLVEEAFLNTNHAKMYLAINAVAVESCVVGKSNLYRRSDLQKVNGSLRPGGGSSDISPGLPAFGRFLAEDNMIASALWHELGLRHDLSCDVVQNIVGNMSLSDYIHRRVRWIRVRKHMVFLATILEPFTESCVLALIGSWSILQLFRLPVVLSLILHFTIWLAVDLDVYASMANHPLSPSWRFFGAWCLREVMALPIFLWAIGGDQVVWRGRTYQVLRNGEVREAKTDHHGYQQLDNA